MDVKCKKCGSELDSSKFKFCPNCGNMFSNINANESNECKREEERATCHILSWKRKKFTPKSSDVLINIGIMKYDRNSLDPSNNYTPVRGKSLPLKVSKDANYSQLLTAALIKRKAYDQSFNEKQDEILCTQMER